MDGLRHDCGELRLALICTPRSGSTWLRLLATTTFDLEMMSAFSDDEVDWTALPPRAMLHIHVRRQRAIERLLSRHGFRVVVIHRHPLDTLISILHFAPHEPATARWLNGEGGDESALTGATPCSPAFLEYATSQRAQALLSVSPEWKEAAEGAVVGYERLVADPERELLRLAETLGVQPRWKPADAIAIHSFERHKAASRNLHYWRGQPGLWRMLLPAGPAERIAAIHRPAFEAFDYFVDADELLDTEAAERNWLQLATAPGG